MKQLSELFTNYEQILNRGFSVKDIKVPYRNINHWDEKNLLLDTKRGDGQWRKFNFMDCMWIRIITELRKFGVSFPLIKLLKDILTEKIPFQVPESTKREVDYYNVLMLLLVESIITRSPLSILMHTDGDSFFYNPSQRENYGDAYEAFIQQPYVSVSLPYLLAQFVVENDLGLFESDLPVISTDELEVLQRIQSLSVAELSLFDEAGTELKVLSKGVDYGSREAKLDFVLKIFSFRYERIAYETVDNKAVEFRSKSLAESAECPV